MKAKVTSEDQVEVLTGNMAAAYGVLLCQPDVICTYPITPQTEVLETLYRFQNEGRLRSEMVEPESEHSAMSIITGASACGARTFTATASQGLAYMYEARVNASTMRLPIVMVNANREATVPRAVTCGEQDIMMAKVDGWIQLHAESCQEILDLIIMGYRLAEDPEILVPVVVSYDGFYLSHLWDVVTVPAQGKVDRFLPPINIYPRIDPRDPMTITPNLPGKLGTAFRYKHSAALERAKAKFDEIDTEFARIFGRSYGGQIEDYKCEDADIVLLTIGSCSGTAKVVIDRKRGEGLKVGLIKIRMFRPFPTERLLSILKDKKAIGVIDRNVAFGLNFGALFVDLRFALYDLGIYIPVSDFICGLCGSDITLGHIERAIDTIKESAEGKPYQQVTWLDLE